MSHIVKGRVNLAMTDLDTLKRSIASVGELLLNAQVSRELGGDHRELYGDFFPVVLQAKGHPLFRIGFKLQAGLYVPYFDNYGKLGEWCSGMMARLPDWYIAHHYVANLEKERFVNPQIQVLANGALEVTAEEAVW